MGETPKTALSLFVGNQQDEVFAALGAYIQVTEDRDAPLLASPASLAAPASPAAPASFK